MDIAPTYPTYNQGYNPLSKWDEPPSRALSIVMGDFWRVCVALVVHLTQKKATKHHGRLVRKRDVHSHSCQGLLSERLKLSKMSFVKHKAHDFINKKNSINKMFHKSTNIDTAMFRNRK